MVLATAEGLGTDGVGHPGLGPASDGQDRSHPVALAAVVYDRQDGRFAAGSDASTWHFADPA